MPDGTSSRAYFTDAVQSSDDSSEINEREYLISRRVLSNTVAASIGKYHAVRYVSLNDAFKDERNAWIRTTFPECEFLDFVDGGTNFISNAYARFDTIVLGGNDTVRIAKILRSEKRPFVSKAKIALGSGIGPSRRTRLLKAGFDDVFDSQKMAPIEAVARHEAIRRRYDIVSGQNDDLAREETLLALLCGANKVARKERILLLALAGARGKPVRYNSLIPRLTEYHENISHNYLKVIVSAVRKKLRPEASIISIKNYGYRLEGGVLQHIMSLW